VLTPIVASNLLGATALMVYWTEIDRQQPSAPKTTPEIPSSVNHADPADCHNLLLNAAQPGVRDASSGKMPIITVPGELGPPNTGRSVCGTHWVPAYPGSNVWIPEDQISGRLFVLLPGSDMDPPEGYVEIGRTTDGAVLYWQSAAPSPESPQTTEIPQRPY
jgi:hypothetical protein